MLIDFTVENFLSIRKPQTLSFEPSNDKKLKDYYFIQVPDKDPKKKPLALLKLGIMYGANASGKSNLIRALSYFNFLLVSQKKDKSKQLGYTPFVLDKNKNSKFEVNFVANRTKYNYIIEFNKNCIVYEELNYFKNLSAKTKNLVYSRTTNAETQTIKISFDNNLNIDKDYIKNLQIITLWNESVIAGFSKISADIKELQDVTRWLENYLYSFIPPEKPLDAYTTDMIKKEKCSESEVVKFLRNADFNISGIEIKEKMEEIPDYILKMMRNNGAPQEILDEIESQDNKVTGIELFVKHNANGVEFSFAFENESAGTKRYYGLAGLILNLCKNSVFIAIDELESSLHPDLYKAFILTYLQNSKNSQLLITTHNREFLQEKKLLRKDALWIANKNEDASTEIYSFADFDSYILRETTSWYNTFVTGKLGGTPNPNNDLLFFTEIGHE